MSTFSRVYKQYTFSDPLPLPLTYAHLGAETRISRYTTFILQQQKLHVFDALYVIIDTFGYVLWSIDYSY